MIVHCLPHATGLLQFVVYNDEELMGTIECQLCSGNQSHWGAIKNFLVYEQFRRQGAGTYLLTAVTTCLADPGERLGLEIPPLEMLLAILPTRANIPARVFEKCGFNHIGETHSNKAYQFSFWKQHVVIPLH